LRRVKGRQECGQKSVSSAYRTRARAGPGIPEGKAQRHGGSRVAWISKRMAYPAVGPCAQDRACTFRGRSANSGTFVQTLDSSAWLLPGSRTSERLLQLFARQETSGGSCWCPSCGFSSDMTMMRSGMSSSAHAGPSVSSQHGGHATGASLFRLPKPPQMQPRRHRCRSVVVVACPRGANM